MRHDSRLFKLLLGLAAFFPIAAGLRALPLLSAEQELFDDAGAKLSSGQTAEARIRLQQLAAQYSSSPLAGEALVMLGNLDYPRRDFFESMTRLLPPGDPAAAEKNYSRAVREFPQGSRTPEALFKLGLLRFDPFVPGRNLAEADKFFAALIKGYPASRYVPRAQLGSGLCAGLRGEGNEAIRLLALAAATATATDEKAWANYFLGWHEGRSGDYAGAITHLGLAASEPEAAPHAKALAALAGRMLLLPARAYRHDTAYKPVLPPTFKAAGALAAASRGLAVLDGRSGATLVFTPSGAVDKNLLFGRPMDVAWAEDGTTLILAEEALLKVGDQSAFKATARESDGALRELTRIVAVAALPGRDLAVADDRRGAVYRFKESGQFAGAVFQTEGHFDDLAVDRLGRYWVLDSREKAVYLVSPEGKLLATVQDSPLLPLDKPVNLALDGFDHLWVLNEKTAQALLFDAEGKPAGHIDFATLVAGKPFEPTALAVDPAGRLYIFDKSTKAVIRAH